MTSYTNALDLTPNNLGVSYHVSAASIAPGGYPTATPSSTVTCDIYADGGNTLNINVSVPGAAAISFTANLSGTSHATIKGTFEAVQAVLLQGITWTNSTTLAGIVTIVSSDTHSHSFTQTIAVPQLEDFYNNAKLVFVNGLNAGKAMEVKSYANGVITLWLSLPYPISPGDVFRIYPSCDLTRSTCQQYGNVMNFRGEPDLPGQDYLFNPNISFS